MVAGNQKNIRVALPIGISWIPNIDKRVGLFAFGSQGSNVSLTGASKVLLAVILFW
jgi:hypothetical protein